MAHRSGGISRQARPENQETSAGGAADRLDRNGQRSAFEGGNFARGTAGSIQTQAVGLHGFLFAEDGEGFAEDFCGAGMGGDDDAVVHPLPFPPRGDDSGSAEIGEVARDFRLALAEDFDEIADADFPAVHEVEEAEAGAVGQGGEEQGQVRQFARIFHRSRIYAA